LSDSTTYKQAANTAQSSESTDNATLPKVMVEADSEAEKDPYDPTNTDHPYNKSYNVSNSATSSKTDTPIMETPASIQVIPKSVMHDQQAYRLEDVIKNVSGVLPTHEYGGSIQGFVARGFKQSPMNYRNGIRIPAQKFDLANVERVEVLKGAAGMLYGLGDAGGILSVVTKQPSSTPYYSIEQRFGSYDFFRTEASATGPLSKEHGLNYRMDLSYLDKGSFRQLAGGDRIFFAPSLSWDVTPDTKLTLSYEHFDESNAYDYGFPAYGDKIAQIPISRTFINPGVQDDQTNDVIDFRVDHQFNDRIKLNAGTVASQNKKQWEAIYTGKAGTADAPSPLVNRNYWFSPEVVNSLTAWVNGTFDFETYGVKHKVLLGGEYYVNTLRYDVADGKVDENGDGLIDDKDKINIFTFDSRRSNLPISTYRNLPTDTYHVGTETTTKAIYLQDQMTFWDKLHLTGGFRYDWVERDQSLGWNTPGLENDSRGDDYVSPRVALLYEATDWLSVFGSFSDTFGPGYDYDNGGDRLYELFSATQYEGGLKTQFFDGKLTANLAYFDLEKTEFFSAGSAVNPRLSLPTKGHSNGVELDVQGQIYDGLSMIGTYAYTNTKIVDDPNGNRLPYAPEHSGSLWLKYDVNYGMFRGLSLGAGVYTAGKRFGDIKNSYSDGAYARLDLMAAYKKKLSDMTLTTQVNINNVNGAEYFTLRNRNSNLPAEPLTVMGSIKLEY
ncbi:MAG: TonB-dependent siderophore receptor, partial [Methyloglobulus sp.]